MPAFIISRLLQAIPVVLIVGFISYALFAYVGDPVTTMLGQDFTEAQRQALVHQLGLDQPFFVQYARYMWAALHGNFGLSYRLAQPVSRLIAERFPATFELERDRDDPGARHRAADGRLYRHPPEFARSRVPS